MLSQKLFGIFHDALGYLQSMTRTYRFGVEVSTEEYWHLCENAVASARETFLEGRLFIPPDLVQQCDRFLASVVEGQMNYAHARQPAIIDGHQRAEFWDRARKIAYEEAPVILQQIEDAARIVVTVSRHGELPTS